MRKIEGMTEEEVLDTIIKVCNRCKNKTKIDGMTADDVFQESYIIIIEKLLDKFDGRTTLENFLAYALCRRLRTLYRNVTTRKINIVPLERIPEDLLWREEEDHTQEFITIINEKLSVDMRHDYIKHINGVSIPRIRKQRLLKELKKLAEDFLI